MPEPTADASYHALFAVPTIPRVLLGMAIARTASAMLAITLVLFTLQHYDSPVLAGVVAFALTFPGVVVSPIAGALLDRHGRARMVLLDYLIAAGVCVAIGGLALADRLPGPLLVALAVVTGLTSPLSTAGLRSLLPLLVPKPLWERANAVDSNGYVVAMLLGPPAGGALVALFGGPTAIVVVGAVFAASAAVLLRIPDPETNLASSGSLLLDAWRGLFYVLRHRTLRSLGASISLLNMSLGVLQIVVPVLVLQRLHEGPAVVGGVWAVMGLTGFVAALIFGRFDSRGREKSLIVWPMLAIAGAIAILLLPSSLWIVILSLGLYGFLNGPLDIGLFTIRQRRTDPAWMGRAFAISMAINGGGMPVGSAIAGLLVGVSLESAVIFAVGVCLAGVVVAWRFLPASASAGDRPAVDPAGLDAVPDWD